MDTSLAADRVRAALRDAGCQEWESGRRGFQVEGDPNGGWVVVACVHAVRHHKGHNGELQRYRDILSAAGFNITESPHVPDVLRVTLPPDAAEV